MPTVPELSPKDVGTPVPVSPHITPETYTYDYIVVGGGTAGCVVAARLSEDPDVSVLLIEQGPVQDTWTSRVPLLSVNIHGADGIAARWWTQPLAHADGRFVQVLRGEALGGTSRINGMLYTRGTPGDYNQWKALGCEGWGYEDVEPYFAKSETARSHPGSSYRGKSGVWHNQQFEDAPYKLTPLVDHALQQAGIPRVQDVNSPSAPAACTAVMDITQDGSYYRHSTFRAFLPPEVCHARRDRLKICVKSLVTRLELSRETAKDECEARDGEVRATGVMFETADPLYADRMYYARARREVVVCGGALGSPQILMLSGIGPWKHLEDKGIPCAVDLPAVGSYLADHVGVPVAFEVPLSDSLHELQERPTKVAFELLKYLLTGRGAFSRPFQNISTFLPTRLLDPSTSALTVASPFDLDTSIPENRPDIEFMHLANGVADTAPARGTGVYSLLATLIRPRSVGHVRLATANPRAKPDVDLGALSDPADFVPLRAAVRFALRLARDVRAQGYPLADLSVPCTAGTEGAPTDEELDAFVRAHVRTCFHYTSTCRMGASARGECPSVVDAQLRVHGVRGLRVADTSVFPEIIGGHTMAPAVMVAERCADFVKEAWR